MEARRKALGKLTVAELRVMLVPAPPKNRKKSDIIDAILAKEFAEEEDDDFVVDDDEEIEVEESSEGEEGFSGSEGSDVDSEAEKRILDAKKGVVREDTKRPAEYGAGLEVDKRRRVVLSDDEDD